jgi:hypothetical protein
MERTIANMTDPSSGRHECVIRPEAAMAPQYRRNDDSLSVR